jgi:hypothetical protein
MVKTENVNISTSATSWLEGEALQQLNEGGWGRW